MLLRKYMSLIGIGSAQIDLILYKDTYKVGEHIEGYFLIKGGTIDQQLKRIDCELIKREELMGIEEIIDIQTILTSKRIESEEIYKITFSNLLIPSTPFPIIIQKIYNLTKILTL